VGPNKQKLRSDAFELLSSLQQELDTIQQGIDWEELKTLGQRMEIARAQVEVLGSLLAELLRDEDADDAGDARA
jgi:hypothetical protein